MAVCRVHISDIPLAIRRLKAGFSHVRRKVGIRGKELVAESFERRSRGGSDAGIQWAPLSPKYLRWKERMGYSSRIGIRTGDMQKTLGYEIQASGGGAGDGGKITIGFNVKGEVEYAKYFDRLGRVPRPLVPEQLPDDWREILEAVAVGTTRLILLGEGG